MILYDLFEEKEVLFSRIQRGSSGVPVSIDTADFYFEEKIAGFFVIKKYGAHT